MPVTGTSVLAGPLEAAASLFTGSTVFRTFVGAADATDARNWVYMQAAEGDNIRWPHVVICWMKARISWGGYSSGAIRCLLEGPDYAGKNYSHQDATMTFLNDAGNVLADVIKNSHLLDTGTLYIPTDGFDVLYVHRTPPEEAREYYQVWFDAQYGVPMGVRR